MERLSGERPLGLEPGKQSVRHLPAPRPVGEDTLVQISNSGSPEEFWTLLTLENVNSSTLLQFNLGGFPSDGSPPVGSTIMGTANADNLTGGGGGDTIYGLGADDVLHGSDGDDLLYGGDGRDHLIGGLGTDLLEGGAGMDYLDDVSGGDDSMYGGEGRDSLYVDRSGVAAPSTLLLDGGADGDFMRYVASQTIFVTTTLTMLGGTGGDEIFVNGRVATATIDGGSGDDLITLFNDPGDYSVTLGEGSDRLMLQSDRLLDGTVTVTDFQVGDTGDRLDLNGWFSSALTNWDGVRRIPS